MAGQVLGQVSRPDSALRHLTRRSRFRVTVRIPSVSLGVVRPPVPFAMQKVVGSSPIIRSSEGPGKGPFSLSECLQLFQVAIPIASRLAEA